MSEVKSGAILAYLNVAASNIIALIYTPIVVRVLGQGDYGVYKMCDSVVASLSLLSFGFGTAYVRFYSRLKVTDDDRGIANLNGMYLVLFVFLGLLSWLCGWILTVYSPELFGANLTLDEISLAQTLMLIMTANIGLTFPSSVFSSYILVHERFRWTYSLSLVLKFLGPISGTVLLLLGYGAIGASLATLATTVILLGCNVIYAKMKLKMGFSFFSFRFSQLREIAVFSFWIFVSQMFNVLTDNASSFILAARSGAIEVAVFAVAFQMRQPFFALSTALSGVFTPRVNALVANEESNDKLLDLMSHIGRYQLILHLLLLGGFAVVGKYFIRLWVGPGYENAYWLTLLMAASVTVPLAQNTGIQIQQAKNMHQFRSLIYLLSAIIGAVLCWILAPQFGATAGAFGYALTMVTGTWFAMNWYYHYRVKLDMSYFWRQMGPIVIAIGLCTAAALVITLTIYPIISTIRLILVICVFVTITVLTLWFFVLSASEKQELSSMLPSSKKRNMDDGN